MSYQIELFQAFLEEFLTGEAALITMEGDVLAVRGSRPESFGTLAMAASMANQYLKLKEGDIALVNDPYSGGSFLSDMTFVTAISEDLFWVTRRELQRKVHIGESIESEGLRIPPTPIRQKNQVNKAIIQAMQMHPSCPPEFETWIEIQINEITESSKKILDVLEFSGFEVTDKLVQSYLEISRNTVMQKISERASGEARVDVHLDSGELLRLNLDIHEGKISLDFGGTSPSKSVALTEAAVYGACFHSISQFYGFQNIANSGSFSNLQITKPTGCWLVGKYPSATFKGMTCGIAAIKTAIDLALNQIHSKNEMALSSHCPLHIEFSANNRSQFLEIHGGVGANSLREGQSAKFHSLSIEEFEKNFPIKVLRADHRQSLGGKGKFNGGRGLILKLEIQGEIETTWMTDLTQNKSRLAKNCSHGDSAEVVLERAGQITELPPEGKQKFLKGDILSLCSGAGGGYGKETNTI